MSDDFKFRQGLIKYASKNFYMSPCECSRQRNLGRAQTQATGMKSNYITSTLISH